MIMMPFDSLNQIASETVFIFRKRTINYFKRFLNKESIHYKTLKTKNKVNQKSATDYNIPNYHQIWQNITKNKSYVLFQKNLYISILFNHRFSFNVQYVFILYRYWKHPNRCIDNSPLIRIIRLLLLRNPIQYGNALDKSWFYVKTRSESLIDNIDYSLSRYVCCYLYMTHILSQWLWTLEI